MSLDPDAEQALVATWKSIDSLLRTRCEPAEYQQICAAFQEALRLCAAAAQKRSDTDYGRGHREGRQLGRTEGWTRRDEELSSLNCDDTPSDLPQPNDNDEVVH